MVHVLSRAIHIFFGFGPSCRFEPTCSRYSSIAFKRHGLLKGGLLTAWRLCHCHPWGGHGFDPVPEVSN